MINSVIPGIDNKLRTICERWTRVMGYHRPISSWNKGKQSEHKERLYFSDNRGWNSRDPSNAT